MNESIAFLQNMLDSYDSIEDKLYFCSYKNGKNITIIVIAVVILHGNKISNTMKHGTGFLIC